MNIPSIINGGIATDARGKIVFCNDFDLKEIRRFYQLSNKDIYIERGWQGHKIERRWFQAIKGTLEIRLIAFQDYNNNKPIVCNLYTLSEQKPQVLSVPPGYISSIKAVTENHCLGVFSDYTLGAVDDEIRFNLDYFTTIIEDHK